MAIAPAVLIAGTVLTVAMSIGSGVMAAQQSNSSAKAKSQADLFNSQVQKNNQLIRERNAEMERKIGEYNVRKDKRSQRFRMGSLTANLAKQGLLSEGGDDILFSQAFNDSSDNLGTLFKSEMAARNEEIGALDAQNASILSEYSSNSALARGKSEAGAAMFSGVAGAVSSVAGSAGGIATSIQRSKSINTFGRSNPSF